MILIIKRYIVKLCSDTHGAVVALIVAAFFLGGGIYAPQDVSYLAGTLLAKLNSTMQSQLPVWAVILLVSLILCSFIILLLVNKNKTDEITDLVIKSIGSPSNGIKNFSEIVNDTNLSLDVINAKIDWLVVNKFATESQGRRGNVYELTPEGRDTFSRVITNQT